MDFFIDFVQQWGYIGLWFCSFIAGSVIPLSSEAIVVACIGFKMDPVGCCIAATIGNVMGGMTCYWMGTLGNMEWIVKYCHVTPEKLAKAQQYVARYGAWYALLAWIPILGSAITVALGYMHANKWITVLAMTIGKAIRYALLILATLGAISMF
ncbi:MAG: DedA family protein [Bacteroidales bacterium]|nr:DedA family protein [Candidatus Sodaliphilus aphodohippi]